MLVLLSTAVLLQDPAHEPKAPKRGDTVTVRGCLDGGVLESADTSTSDRSGNLHNAVVYRLTGDKKLLQQIKKEHAGHLDTLVGVLKTDPPTSTGRTTRIGKTRIHIGVGASRGMGNEPPPPMPVLEVKELQHSEVSCGMRR